MMITGASVLRTDFDEACKKAGMHRTQACHPEDEFRHCRSDVWQGDLMTFALAIITADRTQQNADSYNRR